MKKRSTFGLLLKAQLRTIRQNWAQFLAIIAIGAIAVTLFVGLLANADDFELQVNTSYQRGNLSDMWVTTRMYDLNNDDKDAIEKIVGDQGKVEGRLYLPAKIGHNSVYLTVLSDDMSISTPYDVKYKSDKHSDDYFLYLDKEMMAPLDKKVEGLYSLDEEINISISLESFDLSSYQGYLDLFVKEGKTNIFKADDLNLKGTVTSFMSHPENITKSSFNSAVVMMSYRMLRENITALIRENFTEDGINLFKNLINSYIGDSKASFTGDDVMYSNHLYIPNQFLIKLNDTKNIDQIDKQIEDYYASKENSNLILVTQRKEMPFYITLNNDVTQARQFTFIFPFVFFMVAILVILTTISQMVLKERTQIGTLKAIGLHKKQIYFNYISLTMILVGIGIIIGLIVGPILVPNILGNKYQILYSLPPRILTFPIVPALLTILVFEGLACLVTFALCHKEVSLKPVDSMRPSTPKVKLKAHKDTSKNVFLLSLKMAFRNIRLNKVKSLMVVIGILGCTALLGCGFGIEDTIYYGIDYDMERFNNAEISCSLNTYGKYELVVEQFHDVKGIEHVEPFSSRTCDAQCNDGPKMTKTMYILSTHEGHVKHQFDKDGVAISEKFASGVNAKVGDTLSLTFNGKTYDLKVSLIYKAFVYNYALVYSDNPAFEGLDITYNGAWVDVKHLSDPEEVSKEIKEKSQLINTCTTQNGWKNQIKDIMSGVLVMTNAVKVFAILLALVVVYNLALMNFKERGRDIATLKVLGFTRLEIALSLLFETMTLTIVGVLFGSLLAYPFLLAVMGTNIVELVMYLYTIYPLSYFYAFLLTFFVAFVINIIFVLRTKKIKMVESLKSVE